MSNQRQHARTRYCSTLWCAWGLWSFACGGWLSNAGGNEVGQPEGKLPADVELGPPISVTDPRIAVMGRTVTTPNGIEFGYPGVTLRVCFSGSALSVVGSSNTGRSRIAVVVNQMNTGEFPLPQSSEEVAVWRSPAHGSESQVTRTCVDLVHQTETWIGVASLSSIRVAGQLLPSEPLPERKLLFIGDSVTCGEAVVRKPTCSKEPTWWDAHASYGALAARTLGAQHHLVCYGGRGLTRDWQGRSDTLNAPQFFPLAIPDERSSRAQLNAYVPDAIVVSLGTNDFNVGLGAFPPKQSFVATYVTFVQALLTAYPRAKVFLTEGAVVVDDGDSRAKTVLSDYVQTVAVHINSDSVTYFPSRHHAGDTCDSHPTGAQHADMAREVVAVIGPRMGW